MFQTSSIENYAGSKLPSQIFARIYKGDIFVSCIFLCVITTLHHLTEFQTSHTVTSFRTLCQWGAGVRHSSHVDIPSWFSIFVHCHHMSFCGLRGPPSWTWQECNRLLRLGRSSGAVTLSRWCVSGDRGGCSARRGLKPKFY